MKVGFRLDVRGGPPIQQVPAAGPARGAGPQRRQAMIKTGAEYLEGLRDGRVIYVGGEKVEDLQAQRPLHTGSLFQVSCSLPEDI